MVRLHNKDLLLSISALALRRWFVGYDVNLLTIGIHNATTLLANRSHLFVRPTESQMTSKYSKIATRLSLWQTWIIDIDYCYTTKRQIETKSDIVY